jgi:hypothetical protein
MAVSASNVVDRVPCSDTFQASPHWPPAGCSALLVQTASLAQDLLRDWKAQRETMRKIADAMPAEKFGFRATPPERTYGEQVLHVAGANVMLLKYLGA